MDDKIKNEINHQWETTDAILSKADRVNEWVDNWIKNAGILNLDKAIRLSDIDCPKEEWIFYAINILTGKSLEEVYYWPIGPVLKINEWLDKELSIPGNPIAENLFEWNGRYFIFHKEAADIPVNDYINAEDAMTKNKSEVDKVSHLLCAFFTETDDKGVALTDRSTKSWLGKVEFFKKEIPYVHLKPYQVFFLNSFNRYKNLTQAVSTTVTHQAEVQKILSQLSESEVQEWKSLVSAMEIWKKQSDFLPSRVRNGFIGVRCLWYYRMRTIKIWKTECVKRGKWFWNPIAYYKWNKERERILQSKTDLSHPYWTADFWNTYYINLKKQIEGKNKI